MIAAPPSMAFEPRQTSLAGNIRQRALTGFARLEQWLEREREQLPLWVPVALGIGIAAWFLLPNPLAWLSFSFLMAGTSCAALILPAGTRLRRSIASAAFLMALGCVLIWIKAVAWGQPALVRPIFVEVTGRVRAVNAVPAQKMSRMLLIPQDAALPSRIRVNVRDQDMPAGVGKGAVVRFRVRLMPPAPPSLPGGYDFGMRAYFTGIGATGRALKPIEVLQPATQAPPLRARLFAHIVKQVQGQGAGIAAALATGDQGAITPEDAEAMRRSGLAHLLSISGLHVTALIAAVVFTLMRTMALSRRAALDWPLMLIAAGGGALAGIGYTLLTGAEVPTVRSCVAALLVLGGLALGRDAVTLRLVAAGALVILFVWPEALMGPSFQMSFAAVTALVALSEHPRFRAFASAREEGVGRRVGRVVAAMLLTGLAVELVLAPIALFHFHKAGMLGSIANLVAIPLTTFVVMPLEATALLLDILGLGAPFWWLTGRALDLLLLIAHGIAASPWAIMTAPVQSTASFGITMLGGLWCLLWRTRWRWLGLMPVTVGAFLIGTSAPPAILVTGDGRHVAIRTEGGGMAILRERAGDYVRNTMGEAAGYDGALETVALLPQARCSADLCALRLQGKGRKWTMLVTRSPVLIESGPLSRDCAAADIVISDRRLPRNCRPRWLKADRGLLNRTGGLAIYLDDPHVWAVRQAGDEHPWIASRIIRVR